MLQLWRDPHYLCGDFKAGVILPWHCESGHVIQWGISLCFTTLKIQAGRNWRGLSIPAVRANAMQLWCYSCQLTGLNFTHEMQCNSLALLHK